MSSFKQSVRDAISRGEARRQSEVERKRREEERQREDDRREAERLSEVLLGNIQAAAERGERACCVMVVESEKGYVRPLTYNLRADICKPEWLVGAARLMYERCMGEELWVTLDYKHDNGGVETWFEMIVHW